jgi:hypothetical protein
VVWLVPALSSNVNMNDAQYWQNEEILKQVQDDRKTANVALGIYVSGLKVLSEVREGPVGLGHFLDILFLFDGAAALF